MKEFLAVLGSFFAIVIGWWRFNMAKKAERKERALRAEKELQDGQKNKDPSSIIDAWNDINN